MNELSPAAMQSLLAQTTGEVWLSFLRIEHPSLPEPIRLVCNYTSITRADGVYVPFAFNVPSPAQMEDGKVPETQLSIDNVSLELGDILRTIMGKPQVILFTALASSPDVIEEGPYTFDLTAVDGDKNQITGQLGYDPSVTNQVLPAQTYVPVSSPGLFT